MIDIITIGLVPVWISYFSQEDCNFNNKHQKSRFYTPGYYWTTCYFDYIPSGDFAGPFSTSLDARKNAEHFMSC